MCSFIILEIMCLGKMRKVFIIKERIVYFLLFKNKILLNIRNDY